MPKKLYMHKCVRVSTNVHGSFPLGHYLPQLFLKLILSSLDLILAGAEGGLRVCHEGFPRLGFQSSIRVFSVVDL